MPKFNIDGIYASSDDTIEQGGQKDGFYRNFTEIDRKIIELIVSDNFVTTTNMAAQIGKSRQPIATRIKELQEKGIVRRSGLDNGVFWEICEIIDQEDCKN